MEDKVDQVENCEEAAVVIRDFEELVRTNNNNIVWKAYQQDKVFEKLKERTREIHGISGEIWSREIAHCF